MADEEAPTADEAVEPPPDAPAAEEEESDEGPTTAEFLVKDTGKKVCAAFIPAGYRMTGDKLRKLVEETWKLEPPNTLLSCDGGTVHPKMFASPLLVRCNGFDQSWQDALQHATREGFTDPKEREEFALEIIRDVIMTKLEVIFAAVLDAAQVAKNWIVIDRVNCKSPAADLLIEAALAKTTARPFILVVDSMDRLANFQGETGNEGTHPCTQSCIDKIDKIKKTAVPIGADPGGMEAISQFYKPADFMDPTEFFDMPLPRPPEEAHLLPDGSLPPRVKWQYHYLQTFFASGTHYIILESKNDAPELLSLGPFGYISANGQALMYPRLKQRILAGESLVMLYNTGGVTQAFSSIRKYMLQMFPEPDASTLLKKIELVSPAPWSEKFGLPEVLMMKELNQRAPMLLRTSCVAVDVMKDTSEDVLSTLTCCFAGGGGVPELGLGEAEKICILTAWKRHLTLVQNGNKFEKMADFIQLSLYGLGVITTLLAIVFSLDSAARSKAAALLDAAPALPDPVVEVGSGAGGVLEDDPLSLGPPLSGGINTPPLELTMVMLPLLATLLGTARAKVRPREKWGTCLMAANQIVDQIYKYRLRTDKYDTYKPLPGADPDAPEIPQKKRAIMSRKDFVDTINEIYNHAISTEVAKGGSLKMNKTELIRTQLGSSQEERNKFLVLLEAHVQLHFFGKVKELPKKPKVVKSIQPVLGEDGLPILPGFGEGPRVEEAPPEEAPPERDDLGAKKGGGIDDLFSQIPVESYVDCRCRPYVTFLESRAPKMSKAFNACEGLGIVANTGGAVLSVLGYADWVSITVALALVAMALSDYFYYPSQLGETNRALQDCHNLLIWFDSLSLVQRKMRPNTLAVVTVCEGAMLNLCSARTGVSSAFPGEGGEEGDG